MSLKLHDITLEQFLKEVQNQSEFSFLYNVNQIDLSQKVNVNQKKATIERILDEVLKDKQLGYQVYNKQVVLFPKANPIAQSNAQQADTKIKIHGVVLDNEKKPVPMVTVVEEGTTNGVTTDIDGVYDIEVSSKKSVLTFSFIGFKKTSVEVRNQRLINVSLEPDVSKLEEVVIVGFGQQKRASVIGSMSTIEVDNLKTPSRSITSSLAGQLSGIIAVQRSGEPGYDGADFWIRGISTFKGASSPLVLIDGVERGIGNIDPEEIASFSILKDASATAVYGVRGANGVILINTKQGKTGKINIKFRTEHGFSEPTKLPEFVDGARYKELYNEALIATGQQPVFTEEEIAITRSGEDPDLYPSVKWLDVVTNNRSTNSRYNLSLSGGSAKIRYHMVGSYFQETGMFKEDPLVDYDTNIKLKRYNFRSDVTIDVTKSTSVRLNIGGYLSDRNAPGQPVANILSNSMRVNPISFPSRYSDGTLAMTAGADGNPYTMATQTGYRQEWKNKLESMIQVKQDLDFLTKGLKAKAKFAFDTYNTNSINRTKNPDQFIAQGRDEEGNLEFVQTVEGQPFLGYSKSLSGNRATYIEASVNYSRNFGNHRVGGLLLYNQREYVSTSAGSAISSLPYLNQGFAARATYAYNDRYFAEFNCGYNGSENFAKGNRFGFFPSVAIGWMVTNESFMQGLQNVIDKLKIKASHGLVGNDNIGGRRFAYITTINTGAGGYKYGEPGSYYNWGGNAEGQFGNNDLTWETVRKTNLGVELGLFNSLEIQADVFYDYRSDIFIQRTSLPGSSGYTNAPWANYGEMSNKGLDVSVNYMKQINKDLQLGVRGNFTYATNTVEEKDEPERKYAYQMRTGKRNGQQFGLIAEGLFTYDDFADVEAGTLVGEIPEHTFGPVRPGDIRYRDINDDGVIDSYDEVAIGKATLPEITYGMGFNMNYKNFDLGVFFQGVGNTTRVMTGTDFFPFNNGVRGNIYTSIENRWTEENQSQDVIWPRLYSGPNGNNYRASTWWQRDASFIRLKNVELGYRISKDMARKIRLRSLRIFARGVNLYTWSKEIKMWDPELGTSSGMKYPSLKSITFGLEINL
ncbi:SusC/RagA family TonB-linked outer membrane protein [Puteibacter caeruleilacunae]|nr:SusC/RagA family TonB-linked outer membrane protein [Puteibacter caeruleilacunae]